MICLFSALPDPMCPGSLCPHPHHSHIFSVLPTPEGSSLPSCRPAHKPPPGFQAPPCAHLAASRFPNKLQTSFSVRNRPPVPMFAPQGQILRKRGVETLPWEAHNGGLVPDLRLGTSVYGMFSIPASRWPPVRVLKPLVLDTTCPPGNPAEDAI